MKAVILAAGETKTKKKYWFPENSKPKCLFHVGGETVLKKLVLAIREAGIEDVRIVVGYRKEDIVRYNEAEGLELEFVYNPDWKENPITSLIVGIKDLGDDALIMYADLFVKASMLRNFVDREESLIWLRMKKPWARFRMVPEGRDKDVKVIKVAQEKFHLFDDLTAEDGVRAVKSFGWPQSGGGQNIAALCYKIFIDAKTKGEVVIFKALNDLDYYSQTDERKRELRGKK